MTPLIAVIKHGNLEAVRSLLRMKASPSIPWRDKTDSVLPLEEAVWMRQEKIAHLLLENGADKNINWDFGVLHGAITFKMFALVKVLIKRGASLDLTYGGCTPLCEALTCGKKGAGDIRLVRLLLSSKADLNKKTKSPRYSNKPGMLTHLDVAENYTNGKCLRFISEMYKKVTG